MKNRMILTPFFLDVEENELAQVTTSEWQVNHPELPAAEKQQRLIALYRPLRDMVADAVRSGQRPVSIAGDCCTTLGVLAGLQRGGLTPTLIWLDAHGDFNTWETTPSGFLGGMPLAMLVGRGEQTMAEGVGLRTLAEERVILSDGRDLDPGERIAVEGSAVGHLPDITALLADPLPEGPLYIHFDADVLDPEEVPAMNYPAAGGPSVAELREIFQRLAGSGQIVAVSVSTWTPKLDDDGRSREAVMGLVAELIAD